MPASCLNYCVYCGFLPDDSVIRVNHGHYNDCPSLQIEKTGCPGCCCDSWEECTCCCGKAASEMADGNDAEDTG